ncbi:MAG: hypothetical protein V2A72_01920 [Candidatus Omnitrophota bacterium]
MQTDKCLNCSENKRCEDSFASWIFFIIGIIATAALRIVTILIDINPIYGKIAWYVGVIGFFAFFVYKFNINRARAKLINKADLVDKIRGQKPLTKEDFNVIGAILCALSSKKDTINYFFIFFLSALAIIAAVYFDFFR